jgi:hypothetical protein
MFVERAGFSLSPNAAQGEIAEAALTAAQQDSAVATTHPQDPLSKPRITHPPADFETCFP